MSTERGLLAALDIKGHLRNGDLIDAYAEDVVDALRLGGWLAPSEIAQHDAEVLGKAAAAVKEAYQCPPSTILTKAQQTIWRTGIARAHRIVRDMSKKAADHIEKEADRG